MLELLDPIHAYINKLPSSEKKIVQTLRQLILETIPEIEERLSYGVPYYYRKRRMFFLWPASSPLSNLKKGVNIGFCYGSLVLDKEKFLERNGRKQVYMKPFTHIRDIPLDTIRTLLLEAVSVDDLLFRTKSKAR